MHDLSSIVPATQQDLSTASSACAWDSRHWPQVCCDTDACVVLAACDGERKISLRESYNSEEIRVKLLPWPDVIALDIDGVQANGELFHEKVAQAFLRNNKLRKPDDTEYSLEDLKGALMDGVDLWTLCIKSKAKALGVPVESIDWNCREELRSIEKSREFADLQNLAVVDAEAMRLLSENWPDTIAVTNRQEKAAMNFLAAHNLLKYYKGVFTRIGKGPIKPDPDMMLRAVDELGLEGKTILVAGDFPTDMEFARNCAEAGIPTIAVGILAPGYGYEKKTEDTLFRAGAEVVVPSLHHLIKDLLRSADLVRHFTSKPDSERKQISVIPPDALGAHPATQSVEFDNYRAVKDIMDKYKGSIEAARGNKPRRKRK